MNEPVVNKPVMNETEKKNTSAYVIAEELCQDVAESGANTAEAQANSDVNTKDRGNKQATSKIDRRDFLKYFSASVALASSSCVRRPAEFAVPYVNQPIDQVPGVATYYATTCGACSAGCGMTVKTREGRPVKVEGNRAQRISQGALCSLGQASLQGLYHPERRKQPLIRRNGELTAVSWEDLYLHLSATLKDRTVGILTGGATGHRHDFFRMVLKKLGAKNEGNLYTYEANTLPAHIAAAHRQAFGSYAIPRIDFSKVNTVVGIGSDFLDQGVAKVHYARQFAESRSLDSYTEFVQFESAMSLTGASADKRVVIAPNSEIHVALVMADTIFKQGQVRGSAEELKAIQLLLQKLRRQVEVSPETHSEVNLLVQKLLAKPSVVLCGSSAGDSNSEALQLVAIAINIMLGAYDNALDLEHNWHIPPVRRDDLHRLRQDADKLDALLIIDSDPFFTLPTAWRLAAKMKDKIIVSMNSFPTVTDTYASHVLPTHHFLESWGDEQPLAGEWTLRQPVVRPITDSRQSEDVLLWILATMQKSLPYADYRSYLRESWQQLQKQAGSKSKFPAFMHARQEQGVFTLPSNTPRGELRSLNVRISKIAKGMKLTSPLDNRLMDGRGAHLPVLQEVGDSLTTIAWDSWVALSPATAKRLGFRRNDVLNVQGAGGSIEAALYPMPGLHDETVFIPQGNGYSAQSKTAVVSKVSAGIGVNPLPVYSDVAGNLPITSGESVRLTRTGKTHALVVMQKEAQLGNRADIVKRMPLAKAQKHSHETKNLDKVPDLYPKLESTEYRWGMSIDLQKCVGCSACMVACAQENNVPQVGRTQVAMGREMHWLRLDRYFHGELENPAVTIQPMLCQQCNHAPCEAVCPVYATTHDAEGINAMTYNRCVGTRYCANACPYKVRRFNWWTHKWNIIDDKEHNRNPRALNPDVTVRTRGVMEKCNFCYQRLRDGKHKAQQEKRLLRDKEVMTACQETCPTDAITFGNLQDQKSEVAQQRRDYRAYLALGGDPELGEYGLKTLPNVSYLAKTLLNAEDTDTHG